MPGHLGACEFHSMHPEYGAENRSFILFFRRWLVRSASVEPLRRRDHLRSSSGIHEGPAQNPRSGPLPSNTAQEATPPGQATRGARNALAAPLRVPFRTAPENNRTWPKPIPSPSLRRAATSTTSPAEGSRLRNSSDCTGSYPRQQERGPDWDLVAQIF